MLDAVHVTDTITLGSIIVGILLGLAGLATLGYGARWKAAAQVAEENARVSAEGREAYRLQAERLHGELGSEREHVARLESTRSLEPVLAAVLDGFSAHEQRAQERHEMNMAQGERHLVLLSQLVEQMKDEQ